MDVRQQPRLAAMRRVHARRDVHIEEHVGKAGGETFAARGVSGGAAFGDISAAGRLRILPRDEVRQPGGGEWLGRQRAARRGRAFVLCVEDGDSVQMAFIDAIADILDGIDEDAWVVLNAGAAGVDAGTETGGGDGLRPRQQIGGLGPGEAAALFLIEEQDGVAGKAFGLRRGDGDGGVFAPQVFGFGAGFAGLCDLRFEPAVGEYKEAPALLLEDFALAFPLIEHRSRWHGEPVAGEGECLVHGGHRGIARIRVAIEPDELIARWRCAVRRCNGGGCRDNGSGLCARRLGAAAGNSYCKESREGTAPTHRKTSCSDYIRERLQSCDGVSLLPSAQGNLMSDTTHDPRYPIGNFVAPEVITPEDRRYAMMTLAEMPELLRDSVRG